MEIQSHGHHPRHGRMGQHTSRNVSFIRDFEFKRHQPLARRPEMVWPRLELLARHAPVLFVDVVRRPRALSSSSCPAEATHLHRYSEPCPAITTSGPII